MNSDDDTLAGGLPHSEIPGSPIARISPGLFAACHVLHRLSVPRHPPDALTSRLITGISRRNQSFATRCHTTAAHRAKTPSPRRGTPTQRPRMKTLLRTDQTQAIACVRAYPPRSHHNSLSSPFNQHPSFQGTPPLKRISFFSEPRRLRVASGASLCRRYADRRGLAPPKGPTRHPSRGAASLRRWWR
jgi:hypothetical protein